MRLPHEILDAVVYLYRDRAAAEAGDCVGAATAFWVSSIYPNLPGHQVSFLVTNRHVIEGGATTLRWTGAHGKSEFAELDESRWRFHPNNNIDLAAWRVDIPINGSVFPISTPYFMVRSDLTRFDVRIGDDLFMVGRHLQHDGIITNTPTARFGHLAQLPLAEIKDDRGRSHRCYLGQLPSLPGFSGSPVFLYQNNIEKNAERGAVAVGQAPRNWRLLGVNSGHIPAYAPTYMADTGQKNNYINAEINSGINVIVPAWDLGDLLMACIQT